MAKGSENSEVCLSLMSLAKSFYYHMTAEYVNLFFLRIFANEKISQINFCDFAQIAKNAKVKPREIFPLYGRTLNNAYE